MVFNRKLGVSFRKIGKDYHLGRRDYKEKLFEDITKGAHLKKGSLILDAGCGTGKSTIPFLKKGYDVIGIDISQNMLNTAKKLTSRYKTVKYKKISFEKANFNSNSFDLILFGTSIHWMNKKVVYKKANRLVHKDGYVAVFWEPINALDKTIKHLKLYELFLSYCKNYPKNTNENATLLRRKNSLSNAQLFKEMIVKTYKNKNVYSLEEFMSLISSYSWVLSLGKNERDKLLKEVRKRLKNRKSKIVVNGKFYLILTKVKK